MLITFEKWFFQWDPDFGSETQPDRGRVLAAPKARCQLLPPGAPHGAPGRARVIVIAGGGGGGAAVVLAVASPVDGFGSCLAARCRALVNRAAQKRLGPSGFDP